MFYNSLQISLLQTRSAAASRHRIRWRAKIWWRKAHVTEKTPGKTMWRKNPGGGGASGGMVAHDLVNGCQAAA